MKELTATMQMLDTVDVKAFARAAGLELDDHQAHVLTDMLSVNPGTSTWRTMEITAPQQTAAVDTFVVRALIGLLVLGENVLWSVHRSTATKAAHGRLSTGLRALGTATEGAPNRVEVDGIPVKIRNANGYEGAERLDTGARIRFACRRYAGAVRGYNADLLVIDEAGDYTAAQHKEHLPSVACSRNPQIVYIGVEGKSW
ncbi:hypothetical protein NQK81_13340 [Amycolatopsis roodepoortensis]|uniref:hypothetical protein n=1 Tax=Amycolatopsis roodepoortensis TaxID=700274 RepID=UPI00214BC90C|nr:hypothetical protein [Amycolatopsis roodepoortensis]UUV34389.1 hypothetical protein NQK81_13340 [Amycolatopsis roodepoortensis]